MTSLSGRPTATELVAAVADFLDNDVRSACDGQVGFHARVAANVLRIVERELLDDTTGAVVAALDGLGFADEATLSRAKITHPRVTTGVTSCEPGPATPARRRASRQPDPAPGRAAR